MFSRAASSIGFLVVYDDDHILKISERRQKFIKIIPGLQHFPKASTFDFCVDIFSENGSWIVADEHYNGFIYFPSMIHGLVHHGASISRHVSIDRLHLLERPGP